MPLFDPLLDPEFDSRAQARAQALQNEGRDLAQYRNECLRQADVRLQELKAAYRERKDTCREALERWITSVRRISERILSSSSGMFRGLADKTTLSALGNAQVELTEQTAHLRSALSRFLQWEREAEAGEALLAHLAEELFLLRFAAADGEREQWEEATGEMRRVTQAQAEQRNAFVLQRSAVLSFGTVELSRFQKEFSDGCDFLHEGAALSRTGVQLLLGEMERAVRELVAKL